MSTEVTAVRVLLPAHLRQLAHVGNEVRLDVTTPATIGAVLDALEERYPVLRGTIRDHERGARRAFVRFYADGRDLSHDPLETLLPDRVVSGREPFAVVGAMAGG
jgi:sulfur-carrier protein